MHPVSRAWIDAGVQAGHPFNPDPNAADPTGMAQMQGNWRGGVRQSAAECYLKPALSRPNLKVLTGAHACRVIVESGRATAVEYIRKGRIEKVSAAREVILSGGAVNSPQLLLLSGIGAAEHLGRQGIKVVHELPGVGRNLKDHVAVPLKQRLSQPLSLLSSLKPLAMAKAFGQYLLFGSGPIMTSGLDSWAHLKTRADLEYPDLQVYCVNLMYNDHGRDVIPEEGFMATMTGLQPRSTGRIELASANPLDAPRIDPCYLSDPEDLRVLRDGLRLCRDIIAQQAFSELRGAELAPGADATSDSALDAYIRDNAATLYHPVGTCKMGSDEWSVVDDQLKVRGVEGLRVVDASIMPGIISGNTNFPTMMIAEKASMEILGDCL
jgi:choline dehydrogenase